MSDSISSGVRPIDRAAGDSGVWIPARFDASDSLPDGFASERFSNDPIGAGYVSLPLALRALPMPAYFDLPKPSIVINGRPTETHRPHGVYHGRVNIPQSLPISEYSDSARGWVNRKLDYAVESFNNSDSSYIATVRAACNFEIFFVWDTEEKRLSIEAPRNKLVSAWSTDGAARSDREFASAIRNIKYAPTRSFMWDTLRIALLQAQFDTAVTEKLISREALFRLRLATPETKANAASRILDFECFHYAYAAGMPVEKILLELRRAGVLSQDGQVLRVISPSELYERILTPVHESTPESGITRELVHAFCLTLLCLFELRAHEDVDTILKRHCIRWLQLDDCFEHHRVSKEILNDSVAETTREQSREIDSFIDLWYSLRGRERQLRHVAGATDQDQVRRIFPETIETFELISIFGEDYRYPVSSDT